MAKTKKILADCNLCKKRIELEVPLEIAENREYYPFEYINIHGSPEHALMLFLDKNLAVRDTMVYEDLNLAKQQQKEFTSIVRMTENEAFASVYSDPLRLKLLTLLMEGPTTEDDLLERLKGEKDFQIGMFNMLMIPLTKTGLVQSGWLHETFFECYFLVKDFIILKVPAKNNIKRLSSEEKFKSCLNLYFKNQKRVFDNYQEKFLSDKETQIEEIKSGLELLNHEIYNKVIQKLRFEPQTEKELLKVADAKTLLDMQAKRVLQKLEVNGTYYYALLYEVKVKKFAPKYLLNKINEKLEKKEISLEMATKHLDLLYESEAK